MRREGRGRQLSEAGSPGEGVEARTAASHSPLSVDELAGPLRLACRLIAARTPNPPGDERAAATVVTTALHELGIDQVEVIGATPERPNVIARVPGHGGARSLILCGHLDTKPPGDLDAWKTPPWEPVIRNGHLYGLGSADMKGAVAAMVFSGATLGVAVERVRPATKWPARFSIAAPGARESLSASPAILHRGQFD